MAYDQVSPNTYATLKTTPLGNANNIRQLWRKGALLAEQSTDFFQEMEGKSDRSLIWSQTDLSKGNGSIMNFTTQAGFYKQPKLGDALFEASTDFDKIRQGNFQLTVDYARWAVRTNKRMEEMMGMRGDIESGVNVELGKNLGRFKTEQVFGLTLLKLPVENITYANGKTLHTLKSADTLRWDEVVSVGQAMMPMGGLPADISGKGSKQPIWSQTFVATTPALTSLKLDSAWRDVLKNGDVRGQGNTIFKGGYPCIDGHCIVPYNPIDHDGVGPMGSFLNPKAFLGNAAITTGTTAKVFYGGGNADDHADSDFFRYFAGSPYTFIDTGAITPDTTGPHYFIVYNLTGANAGKWGMYKYTSGNDGNKITVTQQLGAAISGAAHTTVGAVVYDAGLNTDAHPLGSFIFPVNEYGVPIGDTIALGRSGILRGYGEFRAEHTTDLLNGKFVTDRYLTSVFGQTFKKDRKDRVTSVMRLRHAITYPGIKLPVRS
jgi:hypothetical protein